MVVVTSSRSTVILAAVVGSKCVARNSAEAQQRDTTHRHVDCDGTFGDSPTTVRLLPTTNTTAALAQLLHRATSRRRLRTFTVSSRRRSLPEVVAGARVVVEV